MNRRVSLPAEWVRIVDENECEFKSVTLDVEVEYAFSPPTVLIHGVSRGRALTVRSDDLLRAIGEAV